jgi:hypothetical protein
MMAPAETEATSLWQIKTRQFNRNGLEFWGDFLRSQQRVKPNTAFLLDLMRIALAKATEDSQRADVALLGLDDLDWDNPAIAAGLAELFGHYRQPVEAPLTYAVIRQFEIRHALRTGQPVDLATAFDGLRHPAVSHWRTEAQLEHALQTNDRSLLQVQIDALPPDQLLDPSYLRFTLPALEQLGRKDEAGLARQTARRELKDDVLVSWANPDDRAVEEAYRLALSLNEPGLLPPEWVKSIQERDVGHFGRESVLWLDAMQRKDWAGALQAADGQLAFYPTFYEIHWRKAEALWQSGRKAEAADPLTIYARYSKDETDYPQAVAQLKELGKPIP